MENNSVIICFIRLIRVLIQTFETPSFFFNLKTPLKGTARCKSGTTFFYEVFIFSSCFDNERSL